MRFATAFILAAVVIGALLSSGRPLWMYLFTLASQSALLLIGIVKERGAWPFLKPRTVWPFAVVGFLSAAMFAALWNERMVEPIYLAVPAVFAVAVTLVGIRRGWLR